jgi:DNA-binding NtrC family response regulator
LASTLVEGELFGHVRGAFTGAHRDRDGLVAAAEGGTLFFDEIGELPLDAQSRLLRLIQEGTWRPLGSEVEKRADVRILAATWRDLGADVASGRVRRDLYHRLAVGELVLPPLRDRGTDLDKLLDYFLSNEAARARRPVPRLTPGLRAALRRRRWPGNVRELRNVAAWLAVMPDADPVGLEHLPPRLRDETPAHHDEPPLRTDLPYLEARRLWLERFQDRYIESVLREHGGNVSAAARASGLDRRTIQRARARLYTEGADEG